MKKTLAIATLLLANCVLFAQEKLEQTGKVSLGLQGFELSYEHPFAKTFILDCSLGAGVGMKSSNNCIEYNFNIPNVASFNTTRAKWMYNFDKRLSKKKDAKNNAPNYLGLQTKFSVVNEGSVDFQ